MTDLKPMMIMIHATASENRSMGENPVCAEKTVVQTRVDRNVAGCWRVLTLGCAFERCDCVMRIHFIASFNGACMHSVNFLLITKFLIMQKDSELAKPLVN